MTDDIRKLLERQAAWQKSLAALPWPEKVRMAKAVREGRRNSGAPGRR